MDSSRRWEASAISSTAPSNATHLPHELTCGGANLVLAGDDFSLAQGLDASAHTTKNTRADMPMSRTAEDPTALGVAAAPAAPAASNAPDRARPASSSPRPDARNAAPQCRPPGPRWRT